MGVRNELDEVEALANDALADSKSLLLELNELNNRNDDLSLEYIISLAESLLTLSNDISVKLY